MTSTPTSRQLERPIAQLATLRQGAVELERAYAAEIAKIEPGYRNSARNFLHYLSIRQHDIRGLQQDLGALGLSSLGVLEPHALASLNSVMAILEQFSGKDLGETPVTPVDFRSGPLLLRDHTRALLGPEPHDRFVRIMVTMPSEAASNAQLVQDLLVAGMDVMRINCAHDGPEEWSAMVENLRRAERIVGRNCRVQADLAGPKLRTDPYGRAGGSCDGARAGRLRSDHGALPYLADHRGRGRAASRRRSVYPPDPVRSARTARCRRLYWSDRHARSTP
jgi:pyruvate kinase